MCTLYGHLPSEAGGTVKYGQKVSFDLESIHRTRARSPKEYRTLDGHFTLFPVPVEVISGLPLDTDGPTK